MKRFILTSTLMLWAAVTSAFAMPLDFTWSRNPTNNGSEAGYKLSGVNPEPIDIVGGDVNSYNVPDYQFTPNVEKCFYLRAYNTDGVHSEPAETCVTVPDVPTGFKVTITIEWEGN